MSDLTYHQEGDYLLPDLTAPEVVTLGIWGMRRMESLRRKRGGLYTGMLFSGRLNEHLAEVGREAEGMFERLVRQMAAEQGVTEALKAQDQMGWVGAMNGIRNAVEEVILDELIYS